MGGTKSKPPVSSRAGCRTTNWRGLDAVEDFDCRRIDSAAKNRPLDPQCSLREQAGDPFHELTLAGGDSGCRGLEKPSNPELQPNGNDPVDHFSKSVGRSSFLS